MESVAEEYSYLSTDNSYQEIVNNRSVPGLILLTYHLKVVFHNVELIKNNPFLNSDSIKMDSGFDLPPQALEYCNKFKKAMVNEEPLNNFPPLMIQSPEKEESYSFRIIPAITTEKRKPGKYDPYLIILIEKIATPDKLIKLFGLSKREKEVLGQLFMGHSNKEIGNKLFISEYTVEDHIKNIARKMNVKGRLSIVTEFLESRSTPCIV